MTRTHLGTMLPLLAAVALALAGCSGEPAEVETGDASGIVKRTLGRLDRLDKEIAAGAVNPATLQEIAKSLEYLRGRLTADNKADDETVARIDGFIASLRQAAASARPSASGETRLTEEGVPLPASDEAVVDPAEVGDVAAEVRTFLQGLN